MVFTDNATGATPEYLEFLTQLSDGAIRYGGVENGRFLDLPVRVLPHRLHLHEKNSSSERSSSPSPQNPNAEEEGPVNLTTAPGGGGNGPLHPTPGGNGPSTTGPLDGPLNPPLGGYGPLNPDAETPRASEPGSAERAPHPLGRGGTRGEEAAACQAGRAGEGTAISSSVFIEAEWEELPGECQGHSPPTPPGAFRPTSGGATTQQQQSSHSQSRWQEQVHSQKSEQEKEQRHSHPQFHAESYEQGHEQWQAGGSSSSTGDSMDSYSERHGERHRAPSNSRGAAAGHPDHHNHHHHHHHHPPSTPHDPPPPRAASRTFPAEGGEEGGGGEGEGGGGGGHLYGIDSSTGCVTVPVSATYADVVAFLRARGGEAAAARWEQKKYEGRLRGGKEKRSSRRVAAVCTIPPHPGVKPPTAGMRGEDPLGQRGEE
eukprot:jgi/Mesen1/2223/ME000152S01318